MIIDRKFISGMCFGALLYYCGMGIWTWQFWAIVS